MSFFRRLFGRWRERSPDSDKVFEGPCIDYMGFVIRPSPCLAGGQYQVCGVITRLVDGALREHRFIRADRFASLEQALQMTQTKARQLIDEQGDGLFS